MFGFGVGFGVGEFGSAGFAIEAGDSATAVTVTMDGGAVLVAQPSVLLGETSVAVMSAASSLSINPAGVVVTAKSRQSVQLRTAKPATTQTLRTVPPPIPTTSYTIKKRLPGEVVQVTTTSTLHPPSKQPDDWEDDKTKDR